MSDLFFLLLSWPTHLEEPKTLSLWNTAKNV